MKRREIRYDHTPALRWVLDNRRIVTRAQIADYFKARKGGELGEPHQVLARLRQRYGWRSVPTPTKFRLYCSPSVTQEEVALYIKEHGIVAKTKVPHKKGAGQRLYNRPSIELLKDTPHPVKKSLQGYTHLADYVKQAAQVCGVVDSKYWHALPEWAGPHYIRSIR